MMITFAAIFLTLLFSVSKKQAWPLSNYPMFSQYRDPAKVRVLVFAIETTDGILRIWSPHFYRYTDRFGNLLASHTSSQYLPYFSEVARLYRLENGQSLRFKAIHVIERSAIQQLVQLDRILATVRFA